MSLSCPDRLPDPEAFVFPKRPDRLPGSEMVGLPCYPVRLLNSEAAASLSCPDRLPDLEAGPASALPVYCHSYCLSRRCTHFLPNRSAPAAWRGAHRCPAMPGSGVGRHKRRPRFSAPQGKAWVRFPRSMQPDKTDRAPKYLSI